MSSSGCLVRKYHSSTLTSNVYLFQDLTRLRISIPYLPHMFEDALKESRGLFQTKVAMTTDSASSFDIGVEEQEEIERGKKDSTGRFVFVFNVIIIMYIDHIKHCTTIY